MEHEITRSLKGQAHKAVSLEDAVGKHVYETWTSMLKELVPHGRTHRLAVMVASMLQYAATQDTKKGRAVVELLQEANEEGEYGEKSDKVAKLLERLFKDAKVKYKRTSSKGKRYSIVDDALEEFVAWHNMPWER